MFTILKLLGYGHETTRNIQPHETKDSLEMVENAQRVGWTIVRSARYLDSDRGVDIDQERSDSRTEIPPKGGIAVGANSDSAIWMDNLSSVLLEVFSRRMV